MSAYRASHRKEIAARRTIYNAAHREEIAAYRAAHRDRQASYRAKHREETAAYNAGRRRERGEKARKRHANDPQFRLSRNLRNRLRDALKGNYKAGSAVRDLGCSVPELKIHLENQFQPGMSWENYGLSGWHIDHVLPLTSFDLTDREQFLQACHYTNLQPLWAEDNMSKGAK